MKNIKELIRMHDKSQFEIKLGYLIDSKKRKTEYDINLYLFLPKNLGIDDYSYPKENFYRNLYSYVRLITPKDSLRNLNERLCKVLDKIDNEKSKIDSLFYFLNYEIKITICGFKSFLRDFVKLVSETNVTDNEIEIFIKDVSDFRETVKKFNRFIPETDNIKIKELFQFMDEYSSFLVSVYLIRLFGILSENKSSVCEKLSTALQSEVAYRKNNGLSYTTEDDLNNELLIYKYSVYKKYFYNILFLKLKKKSGDVEFRHFAYAIAAGISMIFATAAAFFAQMKYGNFTTSFFIALVISYMFKDRIKDFFRTIFDKSFLSKKVYDYKNRIYDLERFWLFGFYKERVRFLKNKELPDYIISKRLQNTHSSLSTWYLGENVLKYERKIKLYNDIIKRSFKDKIEGINDIIRFDIEDFTRKMDDPKSYLYFIENCSVKNIRATKTYHLNLVGEFKTPEKHFLFKVRLILTKKGIKRIEIPVDEKNVIVQKSS